ncbi:hypothetical protein GBAR_LOCUS9598 [Geodia barretti]|uniref:Uncharacterized protein n=1 Tax=Geodia barretti TaxID=519541 RepID=A0AA35RPU9_GEOBA|nr:hypothetical protein GBAR_LOCUS9598 [Geodia barretti]
MPQKSKKNKGKEEELMGEKASLYSVPDKKRQKRTPPNISDVSVEFSCDVNLKISAPVTIEWMYGVVEEGVVYPGDVEVVLKLNNGPIICSDVTDANISCTVTLPRDVYNISITQSNDIGSTVDSASFDMAVLVVSEQISLILNTQLLFIVTVRRNGLCPETKSPVLVTFGTIRKVAGGECEIQQKSSEMTISSGDSASFYGDAAPITLGPDETICFIVSLDGVPVISGTSSRNASTAITISGSSDQSIVSVDAVAAATQDVSVVRIEPDPLQQLPCPQQKIEFRCQILVPSFVMQWTLPTGETVEFGQAENIGAVYVSSDNTYSATLTDRTGDPNSNNRFFFTSTLLVLVPVNGSNLTCVGLSGAVAVKESTSIIISGNPDPPHDLSYDDRVVIESSVDLQWTRPSYTGGGGVAVMKYSVSANGMRLEVANSSRIVSYTTSHLVYGEVQYGKEEGVVYPDTDFILSLTPTDETASSHMFSSGDPACSDVTSDSTYCNVNVPRDVYIISANLTNEIGSTMNSNQFDTRAVIVTNEILEDGEPLSLTVTVNTACTVSCPVTVSFGTQPVSNGSFREGSGGGLPTGALAGIVTLIIIIILVAFAIIVLFLCHIGIGGHRMQSYKRGDKKKLIAPEAEAQNQDPGTIELQEGPSGDLYATPQKPKKEKEEEEGVETGQKELTEEEKAALYSVPNKKFQTGEDPVAIEHQEGPSGDLYAMPQKSKKNKGKEEEEKAEQEELMEENSAPYKTKFQTAGEDPVPIEHQEGPSGDLYAMPQKSKKNKGKEEELMGEKASLYSVPDKKRQKRTPPNISDVSVEFSCDVNLKISAPVTIEWMYGVVEEGVVYPGDVEVVLKLNNGPIICSDVTDANISCTVTLPRDVYNISITQSNDIGSTVDSASFDMAVLVVSEQISLILNTQLLFIVTVRRNGLCPETKSPVLVTFGTIRKVAGGECEIQQKSSEMTISSGDSASFYGDAAPITLGPDETICFIVSLDGVPVISGTSSRNASTAITISGSSDQSIVSVDAVAGIAVALSLLVVLPVGVVFGCCGMWCLMKSQGRKKRRMAPPLYEEPVKPVFSLTENQAYGQVARRQTTS